MNEEEKRHRINVALWAYAYEIMDDPLVPDEIFDRVCGEIRPERSTDNAILDIFFRNEFQASTGMWIYKHPQTEGLRQIYSNLTGKIGRSVVSENRGENNGAISELPFDSHFQAMLYLAYLGFNIVPGYMNGVSYRAEGGNLYLKKGDEEKVILLAEMFDKPI